ncbi:LVIVD repeat-containing protein [Halosolutus amylolyticus]|uniref:LVIVD repeat-containing protein n=1 Tax=Halosolutus amylolyticus TaxID=2932267 RepID=A0ABD5PVQ3_9EURY|nr:hypothetical protein [Halosolutus amylolyticus]
MVREPTLSRRTVLESLAAVGAIGSVGVASAAPSDGSDDQLRLFSEQAVGDARELVTQQNYAYVATTDGMAVVDWRNPRRPELVAKIEASPPHEIGGDDEGSVGGILDVKVDGDVAAMAHNGGTGITTVDVSDPANPQELAFYDDVDSTGVHNCFLYEGHAYLTVGDSRETPFDYTGVEIVDISDPSNPELAAIWRLRDELPGFAAAGVNPNHDIYVQDDLVYNAFWDAGVVVLDASDPSDPQLVSQFGEAPEADTPMGDDFPYERYLTNPGNAHYVQPSPDGDYTYVGDETFPNAFEEPENDTYGGVRIFDTRDWDDVEQVGFVSPPDADAFRTSHNFDVTANRLHTSWYDGGVQVHDVTDPSDPEKLASYRTDDTSFWAAVRERGFTLASDIGGGLVVLHDDRGRARSPGFDGDGPPEDPGIDVSTTGDGT